jgi:hypothetical protein
VILGGWHWGWVGLGNLSWSNHFVEAREELAKSVEIFEGYGHVRELVFLHNRLCDCNSFKGIWAWRAFHAERALALGGRLW